MRILLFRGKGLISRLIRWQTRGGYSHAAILFADGVLVESMQFVGVRARTYDPAEGADEFEISDITASQIARVREFLTEHLGCGYDYWAIIRFIDRARMPDNDRWFCSELVFAALRLAGISLLLRIEDWAVSPGMLAVSPLLASSK